MSAPAGPRAFPFPLVLCAPSLRETEDPLHASFISSDSFATLLSRASLFALFLLRRLLRVCLDVEAHRESRSARTAPAAASETAISNDFFQRVCNSVSLTTT
jgi:hypothetical protein